MIRLDNRDIEILKILQSEGRISKSALAKRVNLSNTPCWERLERLENAGIIFGYGAWIDLTKLLDHVTIFVVAELENHRSEDFAAFEAAIDAEREITACWAIGGGLDYLFQVVTGSINSYQELVDRLLDRRIGLKRYFTYIVTKSVKMSDGAPLDVLFGSRSNIGKSS